MLRLLFFELNWWHWSVFNKCQVSLCLFPICENEVLNNTLCLLKFTLDNTLVPTECQRNHIYQVSFFQFSFITGITDMLLNFLICDLQNQADYGRFEVLLTSSSRISNCVVWYRGTILPNYKTSQQTKILRLIMV